MTINSVDKAITILNCFTAKKSVLGVGEISAETGYTPSTVSRLLSTMERRGVVARARNSRKYQLGYRIHLWGAFGQSHKTLPKFAKSVMERLRDKCGEEVSLYVVADYHRTCIERVPSRHAIAMSGFIGAKLPLHAGASGQVLLAYLPIDKRNEFFKKQSLERFTKHTIIDRDELEIRLKKIREQGYAVSKEEREPGAYSIVAPVWDTNDHIAASLSIAGPLYRLSDDQLKLNITEIISAADRISKKMANRFK